MKRYENIVVLNILLNENNDKKIVFVSKINLNTKIICMNKEIAVATGNQNKMKEIRELFKGCPVVFYSMKDLNLDLDIDENGKTYQENAMIKARALAEIVPFPVIADDSGLEVEALDNFPGIHSARFASSVGGHKNASIEIIKRLEGKENKRASFICSIALVTKDKKEYIFNGVCDGKILDNIEGEKGFGYDPIFYSNEAKMGLGLANDEIKNVVSHRAKAVKKLIAFLKINNYEI